MPKIFVVDGRQIPNPEDVAMLQALYSRSAESAEAHMSRAKAQGHSSKFMDRYVVNYGHKSIADCGTTTVFIEGVSTLAAKAIQDWPLYSGQETSTRYIDMSQQPIIDPAGSAASAAHLARWMEFYVGAQDKVTSAIRVKYPRQEGQKQDTYERAVKARVFDILRAFLPAGITTQLSWHTNLRQAADHLVLLTEHPSKEIRGVGREIRNALHQAYPASGFSESQASVAGEGKSGGDAAAEARVAWEQRVSREATYPSAFDDIFRRVSVGERIFECTFHDEKAAPFVELLASRPRGSILPHFMSDLGSVSYNFLLDFGSFRDIQRHRNGVCRMPLLTDDYGFEPWYLQELQRLDPNLSGRAEALIAEQKASLKALHLDSVGAQYYVALGSRVVCRVTYALPAALYVMELRSGKFIHPTLRSVIHAMAGEFKARFGDRIPLHLDMDLTDWDIRRGSQTITQAAAP